MAVEVGRVLDAVLAGEVGWQPVDGSLAQPGDERQHREHTALMVDLGQAEVDDPTDRSAHGRVPGG